uniref:Uncharacterized protein n=1 Tax=Magallana gigas TaxID=29159 RepID=K1QS51_MAGGI
MKKILTILFIFMNSGLCFCGWTEDGDYIGLYPGGCAVQSDCPSDERCMHSLEETICPPSHENLCRCTLVILFKEHGFMMGNACTIAVH